MRGEGDHDPNPWLRNTIVRTSLRIWIPVSILFAFCMVPARAGDANATNCDGSTYEMVECLKAKTAQWDTRLNKAYRQALAHAATSAQADKLRAAQRLWLQYRQANCEYYDAGEGTIARLEAGECMRSMTEARAKELEGVGRQ
jgi:uncharacterized protein YecT (DUF1311 family)